MAPETATYPEWIPDEYDADAPLADRLPIMARIEPAIELEVQGKDGVIENVRTPQIFESNDQYMKLYCGVSIDNWRWEIVVPQDGGFDPRLDRVDPMQSEAKYAATKDVAYLEDVDVRIHGIDSDRFDEEGEEP